MFVGRMLRRVFKIRYLILGGAVSSGVTMQKKYEPWKEVLSDMSWLDDLLPNKKEWQNFRGTLISVKNNLADKIELDPRIKQFGEATYREYRLWLYRRLHDAIKAAEVDQYDEGVDVSSNQPKDQLDSMGKDTQK